METQCIPALTAEARKLCYKVKRLTSKVAVKSSVTRRPVRGSKKVVELEKALEDAQRKLADAESRANALDTKVKKSEDVISDAQRQQKTTEGMCILLEREPGVL